MANTLDPAKHHDHGGHSHSDMSNADGRRRVKIAAILTAAFMAAEIVGGLISGSLALLADAAHMMTDTASLALAWFGYRLAAKPADERRSFGFARLRILAAFTNGLALIALAVWIFIEGIQRLIEPQPVLAPVLLGVAILGLLVNIIAFRVLHGGQKDDLNLRAALWHVAGDLIGSVAAIVAALIIIGTGWMAIDPLLSMLVAGLVAVAGWHIAKQSGHILVEGAPAGLTAREIAEDLKANVPGLASLSHIHAWSLTETKPLVMLEAMHAPTACPNQVRDGIKARLAARFHVTHATVEMREDSPSTTVEPC
ncbi:MAG: cation diffusion facilitator family transporter [Pseudomonadota bacterium]